jgi:DNA-binding transcriptional ArsR family regulator
MKVGPDIAMVAGLLGDPARANMLAALIDGRALTASELAVEAGVTPQTASSHLAKLEAGGLVAPTRQGRHRYYRLTGPDVADVLEALMGLAARTGHLRRLPGPKDAALRHARVCYDHLAGETGVRLYDSLRRRRLLVGEEPAVALSPAGIDFVRSLGIGVDSLARGRRPLCRACLDWSARRAHLAGSLGAAFLAWIQESGWVTREPGSRILRFSPAGEAAFREAFPLD